MLGTNKNANYSSGGIIITTQNDNYSTGGIIGAIKNANYSTGGMPGTTQIITKQAFQNPVEQISFKQMSNSKL